jgi:leader peptidase (prepilin peptidase)/N-methyltransferase
VRWDRRRRIRGSFGDRVRLFALAYVRKLSDAPFRLWALRSRRLARLITTSNGCHRALSELGFWGAALLASTASLITAPGARGTLGAGLALLMIAIARVDARELIIPNGLVLAAFILGLCNAGLTSPDGPLQGLLLAVARGVALTLLFFVLQNGYRWLRQRDGLGTGDVKLAAAGGVWLDWTTIPLAIEIAALAALTVYLSSYLLARQSGPLTLASRLPFGLFLAPAIWFGWLLESYAGSSFIGINN